MCLLEFGGSVCKGFSAAENKGTPWEGGRISLTPIWSQPLIGYGSFSIPQITKESTRVGKSPWLQLVPRLRLSLEQDSKGANRIKHNAARRGLMEGVVKLQQKPQGRGRSRQQDKRRGVYKEGEWVVGCGGAGQVSMETR